MEDTLSIGTGASGPVDSTKWREALFRTVVAAMMVATIVGVAGLLLMPVVAAQETSATRTFDDSTVGPGEDVEVSIAVSNYGSVGAVREILPDGFTYKSSSLTRRGSGQEVRFSLTGQGSLTYVVTASSAAGTYTFDGVLKRVGQPDVDVSGPSVVTVSSTGTMPGPSDDPCLDTLSVDGAVSGAWSSSCESTDRDSYAHYYSFTLTEASTVTITLASSTDSYLYLRAGEAKSGAVAHENDDIVVGTDTNSRIQETLGAGTYTIEAATYGAGQTGSFTLTVSGLGGTTEPQPSATRTFDDSTVGPGQDVEVSIAVSNYGSAGAVREILPDGFTYKSSSLTRRGSGQEVRFSLTGQESLTYVVTASSAAGTYTFDGVLKRVGQPDVDVSGPSMVTVSGTTEPQPSATRTFDDSTVGPGQDVEVSIAVSNYGRVGAVREILPDGFTYKSSSLTRRGSGQEVRFSLTGQESLTYVVTASSAAGTYTFDGVLKRVGQPDVDVSGPSVVTVSGTGTMPGPSDDPCLDTLSVDGAVSGAWSSSCESTDRDSYAHYYSFTLTEASTVTITLESSTDPYLYLRAGEAKSGAVAHENDDIVVGTDTDSRIQETLGAGTYTIEAATYGAGQTGNFTLTVSGLGGGTGTMPGPSDDPCLDTLSVDGTVSGAWSSSCESTDRDSYAHYYRFTLTEASTVTITLESSTDPYLYLRAGEAKSGAVAHENDDIVVGTDTDSRIQETLGAGTYTIEAATYGAGQTGNFTLTVSGLGGGTGTMPGPSDDPCLDTLSVDGTVSGAWSSSCESTDRDSYAHYYRFTLTEASTVTITLESSTDPYLYLRAGEAKSGAVAHENDDIVVGTDTDSRIQETLGAGTYTIEAATYGAGQTGNFTLTVNGL